MPDADPANSRPVQRSTNDGSLGALRRRGFRDRRLLPRLPAPLRRDPRRSHRRARRGPRHQDDGAARLPAVQWLAHTEKHLL